MQNIGKYIVFSAPKPVFVEKEKKQKGIKKEVYFFYYSILILNSFSINLLPRAWRHCFWNVLLGRSSAKMCRQSICGNKVLMALVIWLASEEWCLHQSFKAIHIQKPIVYWRLLSLVFNSWKINSCVLLLYEKHSYKIIGSNHRFSIRLWDVTTRLDLPPKARL